AARARRTGHRTAHRATAGLALPCPLRGGTPAAGRRLHGAGRLRPGNEPPARAELACSPRHIANAPSASASGAFAMCLLMTSSPLTMQWAYGPNEALHLGAVTCRRRPGSAQL